SLLAASGQDEVNQVIIAAVLNALVNKPKVMIGDEQLDLKGLEAQPENWYLRNGVRALGELFVDFNELFSGPILTTNFDPLIEVSIKKASGNPQSVALTTDGKFLNLHAGNTHS